MYFYLLEMILGIAGVYKEEEGRVLNRVCSTRKIRPEGSRSLNVIFTPFSKIRCLFRHLHHVLDCKRATPTVLIWW